MKYSRSVSHANWLKITSVIKINHQDIMMETEMVSESPVIFNSPTLLMAQVWVASW